MRNSRNIILPFILLVVAQVLICNYLDISVFITVTILPAMIVCLPFGMNVIVSMTLAFAMGLSVDFLSGGVLGLNAAALVPVAFAARLIFRLIIGKDDVEEDDRLSFRKHGFGKVSACVLSALSLFLIVYVIADGAGTRSFLFNLERFAASLACSYPLSLAVVNVLSPSEKR